MSWEIGQVEVEFFLRAELFSTLLGKIGLTGFRNRPDRFWF
jgi:hypothetical protein